MSVDQEELTYTLSFKDVVDILTIIDQSRCHELSVEFGDFKLAVVRRDTPNAAGGSAALPSPAIFSPAEPKPASPPLAVAAPGMTANPEAQSAAPFTASPASVRAESLPPSGTELKSPLTGTFYRAPAPGAKPFVELGSAVEAGDQVAIVEVMKLMNAVKSPVKGIVRRILPQNETVVTMGQVLMVIEAVSDPGRKASPKGRSGKNRR